MKAPADLANHGDGRSSICSFSSFELPLSSGAYIAEPWAGERAEAAGDFGAEAVADAVLAAGEAADEERDTVVAEFDEGAEVVGNVTALEGDRFGAGGFHVFEHDVLVVVLGIDEEFDLNQITAFDHAEVGDLGAVEFCDALVDDMPVGAGDFSTLR